MKKLNMNDIMLETRRTWGEVKPYTRVMKSKKAYSRKDKSWKRFED